jgi:hypothetical protein
LRGVRPAALTRPGGNSGEHLRFVKNSSKPGRVTSGGNGAVVLRLSALVDRFRHTLDLWSDAGWYPPIGIDSSRRMTRHNLFVQHDIHRSQQF